MDMEDALIPPFEKTPEWLAAFLRYYDFDKSFIEVQVQKMKGNLNVLPSASTLKKDIDEMEDSGITAFQWDKHISKVYAKYLPAPYITPYLGNDFFHYPTYQGKTPIIETSVISPAPSNPVRGGNPVNSVISDIKANESLEGKSQKEVPKSDTQKDDPAPSPVRGGNPVNSVISDIKANESGGSLWPAVGAGIVVGGIIIGGGVLLDRHLKEQKKKTQPLPLILEGEKVTICPKCKTSKTGQ